MALVASVFALAGRFLGRVLTMALGWATMLLFGRIPQSKQLLLSGLALAPLAWVLALIGVLVPDAGTFLGSGTSPETGAVMRSRTATPAAPWHQLVAWCTITP